MPLAFLPIACLIELNGEQTTFSTVNRAWTRSMKFSGVFNPLPVLIYKLTFVLQFQHSLRRTNNSFPFTVCNRFS